MCKDDISIKLIPYFFKYPYELDEKRKHSLNREIFLKEFMNLKFVHKEKRSRKELLNRRNKYLGSD